VYALTLEAIIFGDLVVEKDKPHRVKDFFGGLFLFGHFLKLWYYNYNKQKFIRYI